jgi:RNA polymerase sigma-70 factor, ECF subfamily
MNWRRSTGTEALSDEDLIARVVEGDARAFEAVYDRHSRVAFSLAMRLLGDREAAEDLVQDAFLAAWRAADRYAPALGSVRSWLLSIVHHRGIDRLRSAAASVRRDQALRSEYVSSGSAMDHPMERALDTSMSDALHRGIGSLPPEQAECLRLAYFGGFTHHEIAEMLAVPLGTVKGRLRLGLERLRSGMGAQEIPL